MGIKYNIQSTFLSIIEDVNWEEAVESLVGMRCSTTCTTCTAPQHYMYYKTYFQHWFSHFVINGRRNELEQLTQQLTGDFPPFA